MLPFVRLIRILFATVTHTFYLSLTARRKDPGSGARYRAYRQQVGCKLLCRILGISVTLDGDIPKGTAPLVVCNHFGVLDPLVLASQMPVSFAGKAELSKWPFVGWVTREMGVIFVDRQRRSKAGGFIAQVQEKLRAGVPVLIFPEGTTNRSTQIMPFKTGAFEAVVGMKGAAILPLRLSVTEVAGRPADPVSRERVIWADGSDSFLKHFMSLLSLNGTRFRVRAGELIPVEGLDRKQLAQRSFEAVDALGNESRYAGTEKEVARDF